MVNTEANTGQDRCTPTTRPHINALPVYAAYGFQSMGQAMSWQFVTYFVSHELQVDSFLMMAVIWSGPAFVMMAAASFWGSMSDKIGARKPFMIMGFVVYAETFLLYSFVASGIQYFVLALVGAAFYAAALPAGQAYLTSGTEKKGERLGWFLVAQSAGWSVGAFGSGVLYDMIGMFMIYRLASILCIVAAAITIVLVKEVAVVRTPTQEKTGARTVLRRPGIKTLLLAVTVSAIGNNAVSYVLAIIVADELGGLTAYAGYANGAATLLAVLIGGYVGKLADRKGAPMILVVAYLTYVGYATAFALATDPIVVTVLYALPIYPLASTGAYAFAASVSHDSERGTAMGLVSGVVNAGAAVGPIMGGLLAEMVFSRAQPVSWFNAICNLLAFTLALSLLSILKRLQRANRTASAVEPAAGATNVNL